MDELKHERVVGDRARLSQIFEYYEQCMQSILRKGGEIFISVSELSSGNSRLGRYRFVFRDTGIGMSEEYLQHILNPSAELTTPGSSKISGTGLGIGITKNLVQMMGGKSGRKQNWGGQLFYGNIGIKAAGRKGGRST